MQMLLQICPPNNRAEFRLIFENGPCIATRMPVADYAAHPLITVTVTKLPETSSYLVRAQKIRLLTKLLPIVDAPVSSHNPH